jgi:hypothetical protein
VEDLVSDALSGGEQAQAPGDSVAAAEGEQLLGAPAPAAPQEKLDEVEDIDFLLEEIENKIAPLALA